MSDPVVEVNIDPEPDPIPDPEPTNIDIDIDPPASAPVVIPSADSGNLDAYVTEHRATHETLDERLKGIESTLEDHGFRHESHVSRMNETDNIIGDVIRSLDANTETEPGKIEEIEPTIIPPDIPEPVVEQQSQHWLRKIGF